MSAPVEATPAPAPASDARRNWTALYTVARREVVRILRIWGQTLVPPAITMTLYFLIFGGLIGSRVGEMDGFKYMDFIVPGLVMMSVIRSEEHTSELQSLMRISYAVFCLNKNTQ